MAEPSYKWVDIDGDEGHLTLEGIGTPGTHPAIAQFEIIDGVDRSEHAVYVTPDQARGIIAWLTARIPATCPRCEDSGEIQVGGSSLNPRVGVRGPDPQCDDVVRCPECQGGKRP